MLNPEATTPLKLFRLKAHHQALHGIGNHANRMVSCSILAHDFLATAWVEIVHLGSDHYSCQLYAAWCRDITDWETYTPPLIWYEKFLCPEMSVADGLLCLARRFDRLDITKDTVYLRDIAIIRDIKHLPYFQYWRAFLYTPDHQVAGFLFS